MENAKRTEATGVDRNSEIMKGITKNVIRELMLNASSEHIYNLKIITEILDRKNLNNCYNLEQY